MEKENIEQWKPYCLGFGLKAYVGMFHRSFDYYERNWFCQETGIIHHNEKQVLNCVHCSKKYYKPLQIKVYYL